jgi:hypothetical protein
MAGEFPAHGDFRARVHPLMYHLIPLLEFSLKTSVLQVQSINQDWSWRLSATSEIANLTREIDRGAYGAGSRFASTDPSSQRS